MASPRISSPPTDRGARGELHPGTRALHVAGAGYLAGGADGRLGSVTMWGLLTLGNAHRPPHFEIPTNRWSSASSFPTIVGIVRRALAKERESRYVDPAELVADLSVIVDKSPGPARINTLPAPTGIGTQRGGDDRRSARVPNKSRGVPIRAAHDSGSASSWHFWLRCYSWVLFPCWTSLRSRQRTKSAFALGPGGWEHVPATAMITASPQSTIAATAIAAMPSASVPTALKPSLTMIATEMQGTRPLDHCRDRRRRRPRPPQRSSLTVRLLWVASIAPGVIERTYHFMGRANDRGWCSRSPARR